MVSSRIRARTGLREKYIFRCCRIFPFFLFLNISVLSSQSPQFSFNRLVDRLHSSSKKTSETSVYLRTSKDVYDSGEDLWFKAYLLDSKNLLPFTSEGTLYIQLIKIDNDSIVWHDKYRVKDGLSQGHVYLDVALTTGDYLLAAYSTHSFYQGPKEFHALRKIKVIGTNKQKENDKDTKIPNDTVNVQKPRFTVFPEGGRLVLGYSNRLAYKASDNVGRPLKVKGTLFEDNRPLKEFESEHDGMGCINFVPKAGKRYHITLKKPSYDSLYPLTRAHDNGMGLKLRANTPDKMTFIAFQAKGLKRQRIYLRAQTKGTVMNMATGVLKDSLEISLPTKDFPQGIVEVTLFNEELEPMAERLVYVNLEKKLYINSKIDKEIYGTREKVRLKIKTTDENGKPVPAHLGISVYDRLYRNEEGSKDILTHYYLSTQLKGRIYDPGYYYDQDNKNRKRAMDLLLLTQGWRRYVWNENNDRANDRPIIAKGIEGKLTVLKKKKSVAPQKMISIYAPLNKGRQRFEILDSLGRFFLWPKDLEMGRQIYVKHFGGKNERIRIDVKDPFLTIDRARGQKERSYPLFGMKEIKDEEPVANRWTAPGAIDLGEVLVIGKKSKVFRDRYLGRLDSLTKLDLNDHWVCEHGYLHNYREDYAHLVGYSAPHQLCTDTVFKKPVDGKQYRIIKYEDVGRKDGRWIVTDVRQVIYRYPKFTEEELLKKHNLFKLRGYYPKREFYRPDYAEHDDPFPDYRNNLLWDPEVVTNSKGEATVEFYCSDINTHFIGTVEGISGEGLLGKNEFGFFVKKKK